jgi:hypothetical protein
MTDSFKDRAKSQEAKFKMDDELRFKVDARRNKMLGQWASQKLGLISADAEAFIKQVVLSDLEEKGHEDVVRKVSQAFRDGGVDLHDDEIRTELLRLQQIAEDEVRGAYPDPLGSDHGRVGD